MHSNLRFVTLAMGAGLRLQGVGRLAAAVRGDADDPRHG